LNNALTIDAAQELPPFLPTFVINGMLELHNSSLDSAAAMKPTGIPIIVINANMPVKI